MSRVAPLRSNPRSTAVDSTPNVAIGGTEIGADEVLMSRDDYLFGLSEDRMTFLDLGADSSIAGALQACGKSTATIIQSRTFSAINDGKDVVIGAETGSGKTMAFIVPLIQKCLEASAAEQQEETDDLDEFNISKNYPRILVMVPNKELVLQVASMTQELLDALRKESSSSMVTAETCTMQQDSWFYRDADAPDILICTPAIISKFIRGPNIQEEELFRCVKHVVFDEADMLLEGSYLNDVEKVLDAFRLTRRGQIKSGEIGINDKTTQFVLSAATLPTYGLKSMESYVKKKFPEATRVTNDHLHMHHPQIRQSFVELGEIGQGTHIEAPPITDPARLEAVLSAVRSHSQTSSSDTGAETEGEAVGEGVQVLGGSTMVFVNTAEAALDLADALRNPGSGRPVECAEFHKLIPGKQKQEGLQSFRQGEVGVLICTDAAARGLDLPSVNHVIQAEFALNVVQYLHRIGRASRGGKEGHATSIIDSRSRDLAASIRSGDPSGEGRSVAQSFSRKRGFRSKFKKNAKRQSS